MAKQLFKKRPVDSFDTQTVLYLTGYSNYSRVHLLSGQVVVSSHSLKWFEHRWPSFLRTNKQALVNPAFVSQIKPARYTQSTSYVIMQDQAQVAISRRRVNRIQKQFRQL
ncbi:LytTR family transcriptional regulator [Spirosoma sp. HMF4905]|uniref:LytTR family transcriptional regulator n=1 Tax=Spirosoma arboris TaxID=2682092 RepID=A0A7K1SRG9_9BACT|nr:LytTR family DNA-binding domain-containing protein [Spirosoma arboris]MVM36293.1 LytTR family transcriptional regulator [Spirosoma arboris]